jgi:hypothetical protein
MIIKNRDNKGENRICLVTLMKKNRELIAIVRNQFKTPVVESIKQ